MSSGVTLRSLFVKLGLDVDAQSFAKGQLAAEGVKAALSSIVNVAANAARGLGDALIGFNARAEQAKMGLAGIAGMNLKLPWEEAKKAADELYKGLQEDAAKTPAETSELVEFSQQIAGAYLAAGKNMKDLRQFTTQAVVAAKMLKAEGTAATDIKQAIQGRVGVKDMFASNIVKSLGMTNEQFNAKSMKERADLFAKGLNNPTIRAAMEQYETQWDGVTSTLKDNIAIILGDVGKPLFELLKKLLGFVGRWVQQNKDGIIRFFKPLGEVFKFLEKNGEGVILVLKGITAALLVLEAKSVISAARIALAWAAAAAPFLLVSAAIAGILLFLDDIRVFKEGGDSLIGEWADLIAEWQKPNANDPWWLKAIKQLVIYMEKALGIAEKLGVRDTGPPPAAVVKKSGPAGFVAGTLADQMYGPNSIVARRARGEIRTKKNWLGGVNIEEVTDPAERARLAAEFAAQHPETLARIGMEARAPEYTPRGNAAGPVSMSVAPTFNMSINAAGASAEELRPIIREEFQTCVDSMCEAAMSTVSGGE